MYPHFLWSNLWKNVKEVNLHLKFLLEQEWLEEYTEEDYNQMMHEVEEQVEENQRVNGLEKVKQNESIHDMAARLSKSKTIKETTYGH